MVGVWVRRLLWIVFLLLLITSSKAVFDAFSLLNQKEDVVTTGSSDETEKRAIPELLQPTGSVNMALNVVAIDASSAKEQTDLSSSQPPSEQSIPSEK